MRQRDSKGRYIPQEASRLASKSNALQKQAELLAQEAEELIEKENNPPEWLKTAIVAFASSCGVTAEEFSQRVKLVHPSPADPVLLIDGKSAFSYI